MIKIFTSLYNAFLWSMLIALLLFQNVWIEMRINVGLYFFIIWGLFFIIFYIVDYKKSIVKNIFKFSFINLVLCLIIGLIVSSPYKMTLLPCSIIRDGLSATLKLSEINVLLCVFIIGGISLIFFMRLYEIKIKKL